MLLHRGHPPIRVRTAVRGLPLIFAAVAALAACTAQPAGPALVGDPAAPRPDPRHGMPRPGLCYDLAADEAQLALSDEEPVPCDRRHTSYTTHVGFFGEDATAVDRPLAERACRRALLQALGISAARLEGTVLQAIWFQPSRRQWDRGARWFRCDLVARTPDGTRTLPLPPGRPPYRPRVPDMVTPCVAPQAGSTFVTCDRPHEYRWAGSFELAGVATRPGEDEVGRIARVRCEPFLRTGETFWFSWPGARAWEAGDRTVECYRQTRE